MIHALNSDRRKQLILNLTIALARLLLIRTGLGRECLSLTYYLVLSYQNTTVSCDACSPAAASHKTPCISAPLSQALPRVSQAPPCRRRSGTTGTLKISERRGEGETRTHRVLEARKACVMAIVDLTLVVDYCEELVVVECLRAWVTAQTG